MKTLKYLLLTSVVATTLVACIGDAENEQYGFEVYQPYDEVLGYNESYHYANQTTDTLSFLAYNNWTLSARSTDASWVTIGDGNTTSGKGPAYWTLNVTFEKNNTGASREAYFRLKDQTKPNEAYAEFAFCQTATRIDGSLGSAPLVKKITGDDGSTIAISYDDTDRPTSISMKKDEFTRDIAFTYDRPSSSSYDRAVATTNAYTFAYGDTTYTMLPMTAEGYYMASPKTGVNISTYLPYLFSGLTSTESASLTKTVKGETFNSTATAQAAYQGYSYQDSYLTVDFETAFAFFDECGPVYNRQQVFVNKKHTFGVDNLIEADSIIFDHRLPNGKTQSTNYRLTFGSNDNRATSIDANQLIFGIEQCNPYALLGFFRLARFSNIITEAAYGNKSISIKTELNSDKSINTLTVSNNGTVVKYSFAY